MLLPVRSNSPSDPRLRRWVPYVLIVGVSLLWIGVAGIGLNGDDYQYLHSLAPMRGLGDALRPWLEHDANPHYFRPLANTTMVVDFLLFGWSGGAFHLTNLLFHVIASLLVYHVACSVFRLTSRQSLVAALLFAILASHEYNLVVDTARADELVTIFSLAAMLLVERWSRASETSYFVLALLAFGLALTSKELAFFTLPIIAWQFVRARGLRSAALALIPYATLAIAFLLYHERYTMTSITTNDVVAGASLASVLQNAMFSIGYLFLPVDQETALSLMQHSIVMLAIGVAVAAVLVVASRQLSKSDLRALAFPTFFLLVTGVSSWLVFERWRLYLPSVGAVVILVLLGSAMLRSKTTRIMLVVLSIMFVAYHVSRALSAQSEWQRSTAMMDEMKRDFIALLSNDTHRPLNVVLVTVPAKLGSAGVMVLGWEALAQQGEAERLQTAALRYGSVDTASVKVDGAIQIYALNPDAGFAPLKVERSDDNSYIVSAPVGSGIKLVPAAAGLGAVRHALTLKGGDTLSNVVITSYTNNDSLESLSFRLRDTTAVPIIFDGQHMRFAQ